MKRFLLACFLLTATCSVVTTQVVYAQSTTAVSVTVFTEKVNLMDGQIAAGNITGATATWQEIHTMMMNALSNSKFQIADATSDAARATATTLNTNQTNVYYQVWALKSDLATNRTAIRTKLMEFAGLL